MLLILRMFIAFRLTILERIALAILFCFRVLHLRINSFLHEDFSQVEKECWLSYQELMDLPYLFSPGFTLFAQG